ncbi:hypothetical protein BU24DRAFT_143981 [Aaosphaeria arxii CBS 175.79]|uniref:Uncharacterized protein n=1 Tax=Aaosphaeria arxii CBS 175.79 TaxID=1450172 RepID=A0A6A5XW22_9PLEO|nr:uncharacterized protein BU24DRAFT_143981 [Aaosphaeria arxii CBS 175.79]KAF2017123.1 hypothetical protein BU24DRAFT_143981 [Aaosphaeria arxii CBS 175.79]
MHVRTGSQHPHRVCIVIACLLACLPARFLSCLLCSIHWRTDPFLGPTSYHRHPPSSLKLQPVPIECSMQVHHWCRICFRIETRLGGGARIASRPVAVLGELLSDFCIRPPACPLPFLYRTFKYDCKSGEYLRPISTSNG